MKKIGVPIFDTPINIYDFKYAFKYKYIIFPSFSLIRHFCKQKCHLPHRGRLMAASPHKSILALHPIDASTACPNSTRNTGRVQGQPATNSDEPPKLAAPAR
jgi:hypothetical protein